MPKLTVLISTFQMECIIKFIIHITSVKHLLLPIWKDGGKLKESTGHWASVFLSSLLFSGQKKHKQSASVVLSGFVPSICCCSAFDLTQTKPVSYLHVAGRRSFMVILFSEQRGQIAARQFGMVLTFLVKPGWQLLSLLKVWTWKHLQHLFDATPPGPGQDLGQSDA